MQTRTSSILLLLAFLLAMFSVGVTQVSAQSKAPTKTKQLGTVTITDAAGRVHVRRERPTFTQRRAAAKARLKAIRQAAAQKKLGEVKK
jgi:hypothetical protein